MTLSYQTFWVAYCLVAASCILGMKMLGKNRLAVWLLLIMLLQKQLQLNWSQQPHNNLTNTVITGCTVLWYVYNFVGWNHFAVSNNLINSEQELVVIQIFDWQQNFTQYTFRFRFEYVIVRHKAMEIVPWRILDKNWIQPLSWKSLVSPNFHVTEIIQVLYIWLI